MKPFDLEKAKAGAKVVTGGGYAARFICYDLAGPIGAGPVRVVAAVDNGVNGEVATTF